MIFILRITNLLSGGLSLGLPIHTGWLNRPFQPEESRMLRLGPEQLRDCLPYLERCVDDEQIRVEVETELDSEQRRFLASLRSPLFEDLTRDLSAQDTTLFSYVSNHKLREILDRDFQEVSRAVEAECHKSVILLSGGLIEALLLYALEQLHHHGQAESIPSIDALRRLNFSKLIERAVKLELVSPTVEKLSHAVREYRNLVHPGLELRKNLEFGAEEAKIACSIIKIVERDLRKKLHDA